MEGEKGQERADEIPHCNDDKESEILAMQSEVRGSPDVVAPGGICGGACFRGSKAGLRWRVGQGAKENSQGGRVLIMPSMPVGDLVYILAVPGGPGCAGKNSQVGPGFAAESGALFKDESESEDQEESAEQEKAFPER